MVEDFLFFVDLIWEEERRRKHDKRREELEQKSDNSMQS